MASRDVSDLTPLLVQTFLFGAYTCVIILSTWLIICKGFKQKVNIVMLAITLVMYAAAASLWGVSLSRIRCAVRGSCNVLGTTQTVVFAALVSINFVLSDSVVLWRAWILWERRAFIVIASAILMAATSICAIGHTAIIPRDDLTWNYSSDGQIKSSYFGALEMFLSFISNIFATGLIGIKTWRHRAFLKKLLIDESNTSKVEKVLVLLTESGTIYCVIWVFYIISHFSVFPGSSLTIPLAMACVSGLYPTIIIILVHLQKTHCDRSFSEYIQENSVGPCASTLVFQGSSSSTSPSSTAISDSDGQNHQQEERKSLALV
ncbi:hypothetical protein OF83DRAFT_1090172 [Amylostereum chailletii]|nr:hypothetical protein OF83DRAFT_1090172 [Amylostereum chailletii]